MRRMRNETASALISYATAARYGKSNRRCEREPGAGAKSCWKQFRRNHEKTQGAPLLRAGKRMLDQRMALLARPKQC